MDKQQRDYSQAMDLWFQSMEKERISLERGLADDAEEVKFAQERQALIRKRLALHKRRTESGRRTFTKWLNDNNLS
ncbi:hypothetical protein [Mucilaginibacter sp.]|jgi:hypothetical protein|uniref:hypothetical protein n=1 Tax=Mucilaginibacter sp. TaxID=1882438 RepID=UPI0035678AFA